tara:strand:+ start:377 stop:568 length:192 start_codon:yes stop_codon:yes gene_type:complete
MDWMDLLGWMGGLDWMDWMQWMDGKDGWMDWMGDKKDIVRILVRLSFCSVESHTMHQSNAFLR